MGCEEGCTPFCETPCEYANYHHPILLALVNPSAKLGFIKFKKEVENLEVSGKWQKDDPIPDTCPEFNYPVLHWAAVLGKTRALQWCIDHNFDMYQTCGNRGETALHRLVLCGYTALQDIENVYQVFEDIVDLLEVLLDSRDDNQDLPLHIASKLLVERQENINQHFYQVYSKLVEILAQKTSQMHEDLIDSCNVDGNTPLHILAASNSSYKLVKTLLEYGADIDIKNHKGHCPLDIAQIYRAYDVTKLLEKQSKNELDSTFDDNSMDSYEESTRSLTSDKTVICIDCDSDNLIDDDTVNDNDSDDQYSLDDKLFRVSGLSINNASKSFDNFDQQNLSKAMGKPSRYIQPYQHSVANKTGSKRKSIELKAEVPLQKKLKDNIGQIHYSNPLSQTKDITVKQLCPTVAISPLKLGENDIHLNKSTSTQIKSEHADQTTNMEEIGSNLGTMTAENLENSSDHISNANSSLNYQKSESETVTKCEQSESETKLPEERPGVVEENTSISHQKSGAFSEHLGSNCSLEKTINNSEKPSEINNTPLLNTKGKKSIEDVIKNINKRHESSAAMETSSDDKTVNNLFQKDFNGNNITKDARNVQPPQRVQQFLNPAQHLITPTHPAQLLPQLQNLVPTVPKHQSMAQFQHPVPATQLQNVVPQLQNFVLQYQQSLQHVPCVQTSVPYVPHIQTSVPYVPQHQDLVPHQLQHYPQSLNNITTTQNTTSATINQSCAITDKHTQNVMNQSCATDKHTQNINTNPIPKVKVERDVENQCMGSITHTRNTPPEETNKTILDTSGVSLRSLLFHDDLNEVLVKTKHRALETIKKLTSEYNDAANNEKIQNQESASLQYRIQKNEEQIKHLQEEIREWRKQAEMCRQRKESVTKKKVQCEDSILAETMRLSTAEKILKQNEDVQPNQNKHAY